MQAAFAGRFTATARKAAGRTGYGGRRPRADAAIWTGAMAVLTAGAVFGEASGPGGYLALDIAVGVVSLIGVPLLARWPVPVAVLLNLLAAVSPAATPAATMSVLVTSRWQRPGRALLVTGTGIAAHLIRGAWRPAGLPYGWWVVVVIAAYAALSACGMLWRANSALITSLRERAELAEADQARRVAEARTAERTRIAREMHDVLAHRLSLLATYAGALAYRPDAPPEQMSRAAEVVRAGAHQALDELREVIGLLRDDDRPGTAPAGAPALPGRPVPGGDALPQLIEESRAAGTPVETGGTAWAGVSGGPGASGGPESLGRTVYRVVQEALTNVRKHAPGETARVCLDGEPGQGLTVTVANRLLPGGAPSGRSPAAGPGGGAGPRPAVPGSGTGVIGLTERVELAGRPAGVPRPRRRVRAERVAAVAAVSGPGPAGAAEIRVLLVDDDALVRAGLSMMLDGAGGLVIVGEAGDGDQVPAAVAAHRPDVVLMDLRMPRVDGVTATRRLRAAPRPPEVIVLTTFDADENVLGALRAGASGFLLKDAPPAEIADAIRRVASGDPILSPAVTRRLMLRAVAQEDTRERADRALTGLSPRELDVVRAIGNGQSNAEIAAALLMSVPTVKAHVTHILTKACLANRTQIALLAHDAGLA